MFNALVSQINLSIEGLVSTVVYLLVVGAIIWLLLWIVNYVAMPEPFAKIARMIIVVVGVLILIGVLLALIGHPIFVLH